VPQTQRKHWCSAIGQNTGRVQGWCWCFSLFGEFFIKDQSYKHNKNGQDKQDVYNFEGIDTVSIKAKKHDGPNNQKQGRNNI
jgi:hypothetical protein